MYVSEMKHVYLVFKNSKLYMYYILFYSQNVINPRKVKILDQKNSDIFFFNKIYRYKLIS